MKIVIECEAKEIAELLTSALPKERLENVVKNFAVDIPKEKIFDEFVNRLSEIFHQQEKYQRRWTNEGRN